MDGSNLENVVSYCLRLSLKIKARVFQSCVRSAMLYGSEIRCLREKEIGIHLEKNGKSNGESDVWCRTSGEEKYRRYDGYVGFKSNHT